MKVFVNNVDLPLGRSISRLLAHTQIGSRLANEEEDQNQQQPGAGESGTAAEAAAAQPVIETYQVIGTLSKPSSGSSGSTEDDNEDGFFELDFSKEVATLAASASTNTAAAAASAVKDTLSAAGGKSKAGNTQSAHNASNTPAAVPGASTAAVPRILANKKGIIPVADFYQKGSHKPEWVTSAFPYYNTMAKPDLEKAQAQLKETLLSSDIIVYDIHQQWEDAHWAIEFLNAQQESFAKPKKFILISTVMTWAKTKHDDGSDGSFTEEDFRKRKAHPNFKDHLTLEKNVTKYGKSEKLKTIIVNSGILYHAGDGLFHNFLKAAWQGATELSVFGDGDNIIPTIHLNDLSNVVVEVIETDPQLEYILAVDGSKSTHGAIIRAISDQLSTGKVKKASKEDAFFRKEFTMADLDALQINIRLDQSSVASMQFEWTYDSGVVDNISNFIKEYKEFRKLTPINIFVHGPPFSGKTLYAKRLAEKYELNFVSVDKVMRDFIAELEKKIKLVASDDGGDSGENDGEKAILEEIKNYTAANEGRYPENHLLNALKNKLKSTTCRNQGYVLDGYPNLKAEAMKIFDVDDDGAKNDNKDSPLLPQYVVNLEVDDDTIKDRAFTTPDSEITNRPNEEALLRALAEYRKSVNDCTCVVDFFDEVEIHPFNVRVNAPADKILATIVRHIGRPHNYGPSEQQLQERKLKVQEEKARAAALAREERAKNEKEEAQRQARAKSEWELRYKEIQKQQSEALEAQSAPLRNYLVKNVMPSLTAALIEVCRVRPDDPIDYVAEYLFKHSENGKVKNPSAA